ncbi:GNAT family N-acetyltransferase [Vallitalea okinawensis]|uniref:GNAT family N-acetyltransferase n=1 Tax=Vallitalea okinawensis TaxID=2078660 RepID=UPI0014786306|nr:GNAT family N-acetyltransferase [Vallitalea okinawensis]
MQQIKRRPNKKEAGKGILVSSIFIFIGILVTLPIFGLFGILWLTLSCSMLIFYIVSLITNKHVTDLNGILSIETEHLLIDSFNLADSHNIHRLVKDNQIMKQVPFTKAKTLKECSTYLKDHMEEEQNESYFLKIVLKNKRKFAGFVGLRPLSYDPSRMEIYYGILTNYQGKGIATEACQAVIKKAFKDLGINNIVAIVSKDNLASIHVLENVGFNFKQVIEDKKLTKAAYSNELLYCKENKDKRNTLVIRDFKKRDQEQVEEVILQGLGQRFGYIDGTVNPDIKDIISHYVLDGHIFRIVEVENKIIGTGAMLVEAKDVGRIVRISVIGDYRRLGVGRLIMDDLLQRAKEKDIKSIVLSTNLGWDSAIRLYESCGFEEYTRDDEEIHMRKLLV